MQKYHLLLLTLLSFGYTNAQGFYESFRFSEIISCPFDPGTQVEWPVGWSVYHTINNQWNGVIDSAWCISVELVVMGFNRRMYVNAEEIDGERPVFLRTRNSASLPVFLPPDMLFTLSTYMHIEDPNSLIIGNTYPPASGMVTIVEIPAEDSISRAERIKFYEFQDSVGWSGIESCFATEKFSDQHLKEVVLSLSIRHSATKGHILELSNIYISPVYYFDIINQHAVSKEWWIDTSYVVPVVALGSSPYYYYQNYLLPYTAPSYPSPQHISYYDLYPESAPDTAQTITVLVEEYMTLTPQPFTALRGDLVSAGDTVRHRVELLNNGGTFCIDFVEVNFEDGTKYIHRAGNINMSSDLSCMMFKSGAAFEVAESSALQYGNPGMGFLAMKQGSQMVLQKNATLTIHNTLVVQLTPTTDKTHPTVFLYPGSRLIFEESARLEAWGSDDLRLRVLMLGGSVDVSHLSAKQQALIEYVYPVMPHIPDNDKLFVLHDQSIDELRIYFPSEKEEKGRLHIYNLMGHEIFVNPVDISPGNYYYRMSTDGLDPGWLCISIQTAEKVRSTPFILQRHD